MSRMLTITATVNSTTRISRLYSHRRSGRKSGRSSSRGTLGGCRCIPILRQSFPPYTQGGWHTLSGLSAREYVTVRVRWSRHEDSLAGAEEACPKGCLGYLRAPCNQSSRDALGCQEQRRARRDKGAVAVSEVARIPASA